MSAAPMFVAADDKPAIKEIATTDLKVAFPEAWPGFGNPEVVTSAEGLTKSDALKGAADGLKKQVDFSKEKLVAFMWEGAGGGEVSWFTRTYDGKLTAVFQLTQGKAPVRVQYVRVFTVPKGAAVVGSAGKK
jgi:hypothetical protein